MAGSVRLTKKEWAAVVRFFREEEKVLIFSHGIPGREKQTWAKEFKRVSPRDFALYEAARKVVDGELHK